MLKSLPPILQPIRLTDPVKKQFNRNMMFYGLGWLVVIGLFCIYNVPGIVFNGPSGARTAVGWLMLGGILILIIARPIIRYRARKKQLKLNSQQNLEEALKHE